MGGIFSKGKGKNQKETTPTGQLNPKENQPAKELQATKASQIPNQDQPQAPPQAPSAPLQFKTIRGFIESIGSHILSLGSMANSTVEEAQKSEIYQSTMKNKEEFNREIADPFKKLYHQIPLMLTEAKFSRIKKYDYNQRFTALNLICIFTAIGTFRRNPNINLLSRTLRTFRNSAVVYLGGGLILAPEIFNPILN